MNRRTALTRDVLGEIYADYDEETGNYLVLGSESGFAYSSWSDKQEAENEAIKMNSEIYSRSN